MPTTCRSGPTSWAVPRPSPQPTSQITAAPSMVAEKAGYRTFVAAWWREGEGVGLSALARRSLSGSKAVAGEAEN